MRIEVIHPKELGPAEIALWRAHQAADPALASPYLSPDWASLVGAVRADARICVIKEGRGFLGVQRPSSYAAMGLGAPIADYQGVVATAGLNVRPRALCRALKVGRIDLANVPAGQALLEGGRAGADGSWIADVAKGPEAYSAALKSRRSSFVKDLDKKLRKLERERGEVVFTDVSRDISHFETLLTWKTAQLGRTGQPSIWRAPWVEHVVANTYERADPLFSGVLFTMTVGGELAAANYCLRSDRVLHGWIIGHDSAFDAYSPGVLLARRAILWAAENGMAEVDFGVGDYQFKRQLSTGQRFLEWGVAAGFSVSGALRRAACGVRAEMERLPDRRLAALPGKAMRRRDLMRALAA